MHSIAARAFEVFGEEVASRPSITLRGGAALDAYTSPPDYDAAADEPTTTYLQHYAFDGLPHLDAQSWRHYLPYLIEYVLDRPDRGDDMTLEGLLWSLRPPDRTPPRLGSLTPEQESVIVEFLDCLAAIDRLPEGDFVLQVMEEWWVPGALYRPDASSDA